MVCAPALCIEDRGAWGTIVHEERLVSFGCCKDHDAVPVIGGVDLCV